MYNNRIFTHTPPFYHPFYICIVTMWHMYMNHLTFSFIVRPFVWKLIFPNVICKNDLNRFFCRIFKPIFYMNVWKSLKLVLSTLYSFITSFNLLATFIVLKANERTLSKIWYCLTFTWLRVLLCHISYFKGHKRVCLEYIIDFEQIRSKVHIKGLPWANFTFLRQIKTQIA